ncbi:MAG: hypothetical protein WCI67_21420, partial [Chloroflexales bacterium]
MSTMLTIAILSVICIAGLICAVGGIIALLFRRRPDYGGVAALEAFDRRVASWSDGGRLPAEIAAQVRALIAADRAQLLGWAAPTVERREPLAAPVPAQPVSVISSPTDSESAP